MFVPSALTRHGTSIEEALCAVISGRDQPLYRMLEYQLGWTDEQGAVLPSGGERRFHGTLCLLACEAVGGLPELAMAAAAAVEYVHNFSLIHDDIQDGNPQRGHRSAVWWIWGPAQGINAGDGMCALARLSLFRLQEQGVSHERVLSAITTLDQAVLRLCEGQYADITFQERIDVTPKAYLQMAERRTGALMGCALELGGLLGTVDVSVLSPLREAGVKLGVAYQIREDVAQLWSLPPGQMPPGDVLSKKKSLPVVYALQETTGVHKREVASLFFKRVLEPADVPVLSEFLESVGARQYAEEMATRFQGEALGVLDGMDLRSEPMMELRQLIEHLVE
jgi:geranylgeranyl diphosphate synthase type I